MSNRRFYESRRRTRSSRKGKKVQPIITDPLMRFTHQERITFSRILAPLFRGRLQPTLQMVEEYLSGRLGDLLGAVWRQSNRLMLWIKRRRNIKTRFRLTLNDCARLAAEARA